MKFSHLVCFTHIHVCYLMVDYDVYHRLCVILYLKVSEDSITYDIMAAASVVFCSKLSFRMLMILIEMNGSY